MLSSSPKLLNSRDELQKKISQLGLENEELKVEMDQMRERIDELVVANKQLYQALQEKEAIQSKMNVQLHTVTTTAYTLYERLRAFKCRYYEEQRQSE